jgi:hypothetical protein
VKQEIVVKHREYPIRKYKALDAGLRSNVRAGMFILYLSRKGIPNFTFNKIRFIYQLRPFNLLDVDYKYMLFKEGDQERPTVVRLRISSIHKPTPIF